MLRNLFLTRWIRPKMFLSSKKLKIPSLITTSLSPITVRAIFGYIVFAECGRYVELRRLLKRWNASRRYQFVAGRAGGGVFFSSSSCGLNQVNGFTMFIFFYFCLLLMVKSIFALQVAQNNGVFQLLLQEVCQQCINFTTTFWVLRYILAFSKECNWLSFITENLFRATYARLRGGKW